jgi:hypothetical protein
VIFILFNLWYLKITSKFSNKLSFTKWNLFYLPLCYEFHTTLVVWWLACSLWVRYTVVVCMMVSVLPSSTVHCGGMMVSVLTSSTVHCGGMMVSVLTLSTVHCGGMMVSVLPSSTVHCGGMMVSVFTSSTVHCGFRPQLV